MIAATVGSAVGLGNVWRFPAEVQAGGGAAFLLIYIGCVLLLGIPVMLSEFALGRQGRSDAVGALIKTGASRPWQFVGVWAVAASYIILCFYMVVAGWTFEYLMQSLSGNLFAGVSEAKQAGMNAVFSHRMQEFIATPVHPLLNTFAMIAINILVLLGGVQKGIERVSNIAMPLLFVILLIL